MTHHHYLVEREETVVVRVLYRVVATSADRALLSVKDGGVAVEPDQTCDIATGRRLAIGPARVLDSDDPAWTYEPQRPARAR